ncbi:hypothetical protein HBI56_228360 [Parastagonospora nodorum]|uniref:Uncharacterized protein n=1 Tax=Phaeosphaeria nodorum (strain SN15 / ATCC MYA-4574 / FGSC 10173) TaxID=321614 RepID=A0A7U2IAL1_PHANO|nr:hypothetical protein HBH56_180640 [Parastagonospora nodorum]QRD06281.1 hypothetical protein JI435_307790 [Parastagonospora nodorum SN15]KAH3932102.1 hypothetical protein HBH54_089180 [Parastagonospora nodorum]KAH3947515.1 hypothetical protein HBH53_116100 [Parastagonospora nodorum]KAH3969028.1 hypothetical protein HBH52_174090 [Parastagonospora nodorum]
MAPSAERRGTNHMSKLSSLSHHRATILQAALYLALPVPSRPCPLLSLTSAFLSLCMLCAVICNMSIILGAYHFPPTSLRQSFLKIVRQLGQTLTRTLAAPPLAAPWCCLTGTRRNKQTLSSIILVFLRCLVPFQLVVLVQQDKRWQLSLNGFACRCVGAETNFGGHPPAYTSCALNIC